LKLKSIDKVINSLSGIDWLSIASQSGNTLKDPQLLEKLSPVSLYDLEKSNNLFFKDLIFKYRPLLSDGTISNE
jgi:hypothetical protein